MTVAVAGIDSTTVSAWLAQVLPGSRSPYAFELIAGGHSNLTFAVRDAAGATWILRRPPTGELLPTAHDMAREFRIISALQPTPVPVPPTVALCGDPAVNGPPFYVMELVDGEVVRDAAIAASLFDHDGRRQLGLSLVDALAAIHTVDPAAVGLADLGRADGYVDRQLRQWKGQLEQSATRDVSALLGLHGLLAAHVPAQTASGIVHGDFRLDNCVVGLDSTVRAVLDWELCTLGDPLADLGLLMVYWAEPTDSVRLLPDSPTAVAGFPSRAEVLDRYALATGRSVNDIDFYVAFSYWRLACITEGVYARYRSGAMGDRQGEAATFATRVDQLALAATQIASRL